MSLVAQERAHAIDQSGQIWTSFVIDLVVAKKILLHLDVNPRFAVDEGLSPRQLLIRPAIGYRLSDAMVGWLGYAWTPFWTEGPTAFNDEHRLWQQWSWDIAFAGGLQLRTRLEERIRETFGDDIAVRFRQQVRQFIPFATDGLLHFSLWDEVFFALNNATSNQGANWQEAGFDQNRAFVGLGCFTASNRIIRIETGYLNQVMNQPADAPYAMNHVWMTSISSTMR